MILYVPLCKHPASDSLENDKESGGKEGCQVCDITDDLLFTE